MFESLTPVYWIMASYTILPAILLYVWISTKIRRWDGSRNKEDAVFAAIMWLFTVGMLGVAVPLGTLPKPIDGVIEQKWSRPAETVVERGAKNRPYIEDLPARWFILLDTGKQVSLKKETWDSYKVGDKVHLGWDSWLLKFK